MRITDNVKTDIMFLNKKYMSEATDHYNFWEEHIRYVVHEALALAVAYNADAEIVELAALLHDVALMAKVGTRAEHHINGAEIAEAILLKHDYPPEKTAKVKQCVRNHRSSQNGTGVEELCVADADVLAHFDNVPMLFNSVLCRNDSGGITLPELRSKMKAAFDCDYNDLSERTKQRFSDRYKTICQVVLGCES